MSCPRTPRPTLLGRLPALVALVVLASPIHASDASPTPRLPTTERPLGAVPGVRVNAILPGLLYDSLRRWAWLGAQPWDGRLRGWMAATPPWRSGFVLRGIGGPAALVRGSGIISGTHLRLRP